MPNNAFNTVAKMADKLNLEPKAEPTVRSYSNGLVLSMVMPLMLWCFCVQAQNQGEARLEEIIVTAEKREADVQNTAVAVTAFSQQMLDNLNVQDLTNFQQFVPSLVFSQDNSEFKVLIRGVGSDDVGTNSQPGVTLHLDGVFMGRSSGFNAATYDVERIEVLRGPQGTLYGRNSTGGTINVISKSPDYELSGRGDVRYGSYDNVRFRGALNVPIVEDKLAARVTFVSEDRDGYEKNLYPGGTEGSDADVLYWRTQLLFEPTDKLSLTFRASQFESRGVGPGRKRLPTPADSLLEAASEITEDPDLYTVWKDTAEAQTVDLDLYTVQADWELPSAMLTALVSRGKTSFTWLADGDQTRATAEEGGHTFILGADPISSKQGLAELRLTSLPSSSFEWLLGAFYFEEETSTRFELTSASLAGSKLDSVFVRSYWDIDTTSHAFFGQIADTFGANDQFKLTAGVRYTRDKGEGEIWDRVEFSLWPFPSLTEENLRETWSETTWKLGADWQVTPTSLLYASVSKGFRAGGFNFEAPVPGKSIYDPEDLTAYEIGSKNRFLNERLQLNLAAFLYDYKDFQVFQIINTALYIENAGEVSNYGIEAELTALVTSAFEIDAHFSYQRGRFDQFLSIDPLYTAGPGGSAPAGGVEPSDLSGNHLPNTPDFSGHLGAQYTWPISNIGSLTLRAQSYYQTDVYSRAFNLDVGKQDAHTKSSLQARFDDGDENWYLVAGVNNIEDEAVVANVAITATGRVLANIGAPRTWYAGFGMEF